MDCNHPSVASRLVRLLATGVGLASGAYAAWAAVAWYRYGEAGRERNKATPPDLLDEVMPDYEIEERHSVVVEAPAAATFAAARELDIERAPLARAILAVRTLPSRARGHAAAKVHRSLLETTQALGWRVLAHEPGRALALGAYTRPWEPEVVFHGLPPEDFVRFGEPGWVKIVWTLEAEPLGPMRSRFVTRTRVGTTDPTARARFRRYWAVMSPGILLIRRASLPLVKRAAEQRGARARAAGLRD